MEKVQNIIKNNSAMTGNQLLDHIQKNSQTIKPIASNPINIPITPPPREIVNNTLNKYQLF